MLFRKKKLIPPCDRKDCMWYKDHLHDKCSYQNKNACSTGYKSDCRAFEIDNYAGKK